LGHRLIELSRHAVSINNILTNFKPHASSSTTSIMNATPAPDQSFVSHVQEFGVSGSTLNQVARDQYFIFKFKLKFKFTLFGDELAGHIANVGRLFWRLCIKGTRVAFHMSVA
jgi:hypothetical protein